MTMKKRIAPDRISELENYEVFVFGSNLQGQHAGGAAAAAANEGPGREASSAVGKRC